MTWLVKKIEKDIGKPIIRHILTVKTEYGGYDSWEEFVEENSKTMQKRGGDGEYIIIPVGKIVTKNRKYRISGNFKKPVVKFTLGW